MKFYSILLIFSLIFLIGCTTEVKEEVVVVDTTEILEEIKDDVNWRNIKLMDVRTGTEFTVTGFTKPVLLESFAVWCPTCTNQQEEIKAFHKVVGEDVISISVDTDPNEDESKVLAHIERNGFDWHYAIAQAEFTQSLIDEFGVNIVNAPRVPMLLICQDGTVKKLKDGVKEVDVLLEEIKNCGND
jgi:hypothetical protein